jgi:hypothetical protein
MAQKMARTVVFAVEMSAAQWRGEVPWPPGRARHGQPCGWRSGCPPWYSGRAGLFVAVLLGDLVLGASLRGMVLTAANLVTAVVEEAALMVAVLVGAFLARK